MAEHSPIRLITVEWVWVNLPYWVSVHFVRHKIGIEHYISTQRPDRTHTAQPRHLLPQSAPVTHRAVANLQAILSISRKRLCSQASKETREAWMAVLEHLRYKEPELFDVCVPECVYRGFCPEMRCCGFVTQKAFQEAVQRYRERQP